MSSHSSCVRTGANFVLTLFTNDPSLARKADAAGIDRIGLDLEKIGKAERQGKLNTWISNHEECQLHAVRESLQKAELFVRTNPIHAGSGAEIDRLIRQGAQVLMLPYFHSVDEAERFIALVDHRAQVSLLVETAAAAARIEDIVQLDGIDEIHVGLNDLHLSLGLDSHFELLGSRLLDMLSETVRAAGLPFGFGGVARVDDTRLPMPSDLVYAQYPRLAADRALVSRVFLTPDYRNLDLKEEVAAFRRRMGEWYQRSPEDWRVAQRELSRIARLRASSSGDLPRSD